MAQTPTDDPASQNQANFDEARFRQVLGHFPTGVTVVTAIWEGRPLGLAVNSFTSLSLHPPLVAFCVNATSRTWPHIARVGAFSVNVLSQDQEEISRKFSRAGAEDRFSGTGWRAAPSGAPLIDGILAWIDCVVEAEHPGGDHRIVVGRARHLGVEREGRPLVFYRGGYGRFEV